jgi:hypothetical protein
MQRQAKQIFAPKHGTPGEGRMVADSFRFYRMMHIRDIYFVGGFGTMQWVDPGEYAATLPDSIVTFPPHETVDAISARFGDALVEHFLGPGPAAEGGASPGAPTSGLRRSDAHLISIDAAGADVRVRRDWQSSVHRLAFHSKVHTPEEAFKAVERALRNS